MKARLLTLLAVLGIATGGLVVVGCGNSDSGGGSGDTLTVGSDIPYPPFEFGKAPAYEGFDVELVDEIASKLDRKIKWQDTSFDTIFRDLAQGKFDMVASASTITAEREQTVDFSDPYYEAQQALVVAPGSDIKTVDDLGGKTVGAQDGTTGETYANDETDAGSVRGYPQGPEAIQAVKAGQVDAVIIDEPVAKDALEKQGGIEVVQTISTDELYGLAFPQTSEGDKLRKEVNSALKELKDDGTLADLYEKYFPGTEPPEAVLSGTNDQLK